jgi:hypothetical protein
MLNTNFQKMKPKTLKEFTFDLCIAKKSYQN